MEGHWDFPLFMALCFRASFWRPLQGLQQVFEPYNGYENMRPWSSNCLGVKGVVGAGTSLSQLGCLFVCLLILGTIQDAGAISKVKSLWHRSKVFTKMDVNPELLWLLWWKKLLYALYQLHNCRVRVCISSIWMAAILFSIAIIGRHAIEVQVLTGRKRSYVIIKNVFSISNT